MFSLQNHKTIHTNKQMGKIIHLHQEIITTHKHKQHLKGLSKPCCTISSNANKKWKETSTSSEKILSPRQILSFHDITIMILQSCNTAMK